MVWQGFFDQLVFSGVGQGQGWDEDDKTAGMVVSGTGDLIATVTAPTAVVQSIRARRTRSEGKYYFEITCGGIGSGAVAAWAVGIADPVVFLPNYAFGASDPNGAMLITEEGTGSLGGIYVGAQSTTPYTFPTIHIAAGNVIGVAANLTTHDIWFHRNGSYVRGNPSTGASPIDWGNATASATMRPVFQGVTQSTTCRATLNTGPTFTYALPTGFLAWG